jgi:hypothetical protein
MLIATETPDHPRGATLLARIPEDLDESSRRQKYDVPLANALSARGLKYFCRGFTLPAAGGGAPGIGIEVRADSVEVLALVVQEIADLGALPETVIEIETDKATVECTLAEGLHH